MPGFLGALGDIGAGLGPQLDQIAQQFTQNQSSGNFGNALAQIYGGGGATPAPTPSAGPLGALQSLFSGSPQQFSAQPAVAQGGAGLPGQTQTQNPGQGQPQAPPQATPQPQPQAQPTPAPQAGGQPQAKPAAPDSQQGGQGPLDLPTLVRHLVANGVTGRRLGDAVDKFIPLLNAQGLQQYRQAGLQLQREKFDYSSDPTRAGSPAQNRVANQGIAAQRMEGVQKRFQARMDAATEKLKNARTDKEAMQAKQDLDKVASELRAELQSELNIANSPGTPAEEQKAAMEKAAEIRQQIEAATDTAIKGRREGGGDKTDASSAEAGGAGETAYGPDGKPMRYKGTGDRKDPKNWEEVSGGQ